MAKLQKAIKAYKNEEFLTSPEARTIRILSEIYEPEARFKKNKIMDTIVFFGSARLVPLREAKKMVSAAKKKKGKRGYKTELEKAERLLAMSRYYDDAVELSKRITQWNMNLPVDEHSFTVCSGGGPGIMEAASKGAKLAGGKSIGLNISIPFEQYVNKFVENELAFEFHYFFTRKFWFAYLAKALVIFPGGFGTMDEFMEIITLVQTGKIKKEMKIVVYDSEFWNKIINFQALIDAGVVSKEDMNLFQFADSVDEAYKLIIEHLEKHYLKNGKG